MTMDIGLRAHDYGKLPVEVLFERITKDGFHTIQLAIPKAIEGINRLEEVDEKRLTEIKQAMAQYDMKIAVFGCYVDLGHHDPKVRQEQVNQFLKGMELAKDLGARCIGSETTYFPLEGSKEEREAAFEGLVDSVKQIVKKGEEIGLDVAIEPVAKHTLNTPQLTKKLLKRVPSERLKIIFDPINLLTSDYMKDQVAVWKAAFECLGDRIWALHMKGARMDAEGQLISTSFASSEVDFKPIIDWIKVHLPETPVLREEIKPAEAKSDYAYIKSLID